MTREELIALKENRGYSVAKLSEYSGVPEGTIRKIITGESKHPRTATLNALKKVLFGDQSVYSGKTYKYEGGYIGMEVFNADVYLQNIEYGSNHNISERTVKSVVLFSCRKMTYKKERTL